MRKRPILAVLLGGGALVLVLSFRTPEAPLAEAPGSLPIVEGDGCCAPAASAHSVAASGTYAGSAVQTRFGPVQVKVTLEAGRITAVEAIQAPADDPRSAQISDWAIPRLIESTLDVQSARVDSISGATYTCQAFMQSLQSALDQAGG